MRWLLAMSLFWGATEQEAALRLHNRRPAEAALYWAQLAETLRQEQPLAQIAAYNRILALIAADSVATAASELSLLIATTSEPRQLSRLEALRGYLLARRLQGRDLTEALPPLQAALRLWPDNAYARYNLELVLRRLPPPPPQSPPPPAFLRDDPSPYPPPPTEALGSIWTYPNLSNEELSQELEALAGRERQYLQQLRRSLPGRKPGTPAW